MVNYDQTVSTSSATANIEPLFCINIVPGQFHMRNGSTANLKNKQILVNLNVLFRQIAKFEGDMMKIEMKHQPGVTVL